MNAGTGRSTASNAIMGTDLRKGEHGDGAFDGNETGACPERFTPTGPPRRTCGEQSIRRYNVAANLHAMNFTWR